MPAQYYAVATLAGQAKIAAAIANAGAIEITAAAAGDGNGAPITPIETMAGLVHEVWRGAPISVGRDPANPTQVLVEVVIPDTAAPATIRELALFTADGQCFAVANYPATDLAAPSQGAINSIEVLIPIVVDTAANVTIVVNPAEIVRVERLGRAPFISIDAFANAPPANPAMNALVVVGAVPTGAFANQAHRFAQWNGTVWTTAMAHTGTVVHDIATGTYWRRTADGWALFTATDTDYGLIRLADIFITASLTKTVGPASDFASLAAAFAWLKTRIVCLGAEVTLQLTAGQHDLAAGLVIDYAHADKVRIVGQAAGFPAEANITTSGYTAAARAADSAANLAALRALFPTELRLTGVAGLEVRRGLAALQNVLVTSTTAAVGLIVHDNCTLTKVAFHGTTNAIDLRSGRMVINQLAIMHSSAVGVAIGSAGVLHSDGELVLCSCGDAPVRSDGALVSINDKRILCKGNATSFYLAGGFAKLGWFDAISSGGGLYCFGGEFQVERFLINSNAGNGVHADGGSRVRLGGAQVGGCTNQITYNTSSGMIVSRGSRVYAKPNATSTLSIGNHAAGFGSYAMGESYVDLANVTLNGNWLAIATEDGSFQDCRGAVYPAGQMAPAANTIGNNNSFNRV